MARIRSLRETLTPQALHQVLRLGAIAAALGLIAWSGTLPQVAVAQGPAAADDDPFADELNPFGGRPKQRQPSDKPAVPLRRPLEQETPGEPLPEPSPESKESAPKSGRPDQPAEPPVRRPAATVPRAPLPVPFPEADSGAKSRVRAVPGGSSELDTGPGGWEPSPAEPIVMEAEKLDKAGELAAARDKLREAIKADPNYTMAYLALGVVSRPRSTPARRGWPSAPTSQSSICGGASPGFIWVSSASPSRTSRRRRVSPTTILGRSCGAA